MHLSHGWREVGLGLDRRIGFIAGRAGGVVPGAHPLCQPASLTSSWGDGPSREMGWDCKNPKLLRLGSLLLIEMPRMSWLVKRD